MKNNTLTIERILDYYDVPQLFLARDKFDTQYLCLLYEDEPFCKYSAIRISKERYSTLYLGQRDLRSSFVMPEYPSEYFDVVFQGGEYELLPLSLGELPEERLPEEGYYLDNSDSDVHTVSVPRRERSLFYKLMHRHGWVAM